MLANIEGWLGSFVIFQGIRSSIANKPYIFVIFQRGGGGVRTPFPPLDPPMLVELPDKRNKKLLDLQPNLCVSL